MKTSQLIEIFRVRGPKRMSRPRTGHASFQVLKHKILEDGTKIVAAQSPAIPLPGNEPYYSLNVRKVKRSR